VKSGPRFLLGLFFAVLIAWAGMVLGSHLQLGRMTPYYDQTDSLAYPERPMGIASRGQLVYADLGCAACHTQQVRRPGSGGDQARGWGERQSVARDYIFSVRPQLGASRFGPDLANLAGRKPQAPTAETLLRLLYTGSATHPPYKFLFATGPVEGEPSADALALSGAGAPPAGQAVVPTARARALVAYLLNSNFGYEYPEARPLPMETKSAPQPEAKK
jgi:cytochrome c oxidase cbb3-type subunit 2